MALNEANVGRGVTGTVSVGAIGAAAPTSTASALTGYTDLGYVSDEGVTKTIPSGGDPDQIRAWQNNAVVLTIRNPTEDNPTFGFTLLESKLEVVQFAMGVSVTQSANDGSYELDTNDTRTPVRLILDVVDGSNLTREFLPRAVVTEVGDQVYAFGEPIGWQVTVEAERDGTLGYNVKTWNTRLKTA